MTFSCVENIGAALQCIALARFLLNTGYNVDVIDYRPQYLTQGYKCYYPLSAQGEKNSLKTVIKKIVLNGRIPMLLNRKRKFKKLYKSNVRFSSKCFCINQLKSLGEYDCFIAGSDQIWNAAISAGEMDPAFLLEFTDKRKIAYAASCGTVLPEKNLKKIIPVLKTFSAVSVRESSLCKQLLSNGVKDVQCVADPTFLLDRDEWRRMARKLRHPKPFILTYFLEENEKICELVQQMTNYKEIDVIDVSPRRFLGKEFVAKRRAYCSPDEFLGLIQNAECILTNSFHGTVFSILFEKPFVTILHSKYPERVNDLMALLDMKDKILNTIDSKTKMNAYKPYSQNQIDLIMNLRQQSRFFLLDALEKEV